MPEFKLEDVQHATYNALRNIGKTVELVENPFTKFQLYKLKRKELFEGWDARKFPWRDKQYPARRDK